VFGKTHAVFQKNNCNKRESDIYKTYIDIDIISIYIIDFSILVD